MESAFDFISVTDKPALLALTTPAWQEAARAALTKLGYKIQEAATHADFISNFSQVSYELAVIEEHFASDASQQNQSLVYLQTIPMSQRRHCTVVLAGDSFTTLHSMQAFQQSVHLVVNPSEISLLTQIIQKGVAENDLFLQPYRQAQRRQIGAATGD